MFKTSKNLPHPWHPAILISIFVGLYEEREGNFVKFEKNLAVPVKKLGIIERTWVLWVLLEQRF